MPEKNTASFPKTLRHSREGGNPQFPRMREFNENTIQTDQTPHSHTGLPQRLNVIPAHAGIHRPIGPMPEKNTASFPKILRHSREGGNPQFPRMREFNENTLQTDQTPHFHTGLPQRHSREGGNPQFPRMREFNENTIQTDQTPHSHTGLPQRHSREGGNPQFPPSRGNDGMFLGVTKCFWE